MQSKSPNDSLFLPKSLSWSLLQEDTRRLNSFSQMPFKPFFVFDSKPSSALTLQILLPFLSKLCSHVYAIAYIVWHEEYGIQQRMIIFPMIKTCTNHSVICSLTKRLSLQFSLRVHPSRQQILNCISTQMQQQSSLNNNRQEDWLSRMRFSVRSRESEWNTIPSLRDTTFLTTEWSKWRKMAFSFPLHHHLVSFMSLTHLFA